MDLSPTITTFLTTMRASGNPGAVRFARGRHGWALHSMDYHRTERSAAGVAGRRHVGTYTLYLDTTGSFWRRIDLDSASLRDVIGHIGKRVKAKGAAVVVGPDGVFTPDRFAARLDEIMAERGVMP